MKTNQSSINLKNKKEYINRIAQSMDTDFMDGIVRDVLSGLEVQVCLINNFIELIDSNAGETLIEINIDDAFKLACQNYDAVLSDNEPKQEVIDRIEYVKRIQKDINAVLNNQIKKWESSIKQ